MRALVEAALALSVIGPRRIVSAFVEAMQFNRWGDCPHCHQSYTGSYEGVLHCTRCSSRSKLVAQ